METREEQIETAWLCKSFQSNHRYDEKSFKDGIRWADEHPNLYNDEKYHTVKVSDLDELNRKAQLYDEFKFVLYDDFLKKACEYLYKLNQMNFKEYGRHCPLVNVSEFRKAMEEYEVYSK